MERRLFLAALGGGIASATTAGASVRKAARPALISTYISNVADTNKSRVLPPVGSALELRVDSERAYDRRSVVVSTPDGDALGYLPSVHGRTIEPLLSAGFDMKAKVVASRMMPRPAVRIEISLRPNSQPPPV